jgi:transketolase
MKEDYIRGIQDKANELREMTLDMCEKSKRGHLTSCFSSAEILSVLYYGGVLKYNPKNPKWEQRDRFLLSKGQASPMLYAALADIGFFPKNWLDTFCQKDGKFGVHLQNDIPGVECTFGSLGHGLGIGVGMALAAKMNNDPYFTIVELGDGELYEGTVWESAMSASHYRLNNLIAIVDRNWQCATNFTESSLRLNPIDKKFESFGWEVKSIDGHSIEELLGAFEGFRSYKRDAPYAIIADTIKGKGSSYIESRVEWHSRAPANSEEAQIIRNELNYRRKNG